MKTIKKQASKPHARICHILNTTLRRFELVSLNIEQYHSRGFHNSRQHSHEYKEQIMELIEQNLTAVHIYEKLSEQEVSTSYSSIHRYIFKSTA